MATPPKVIEKDIHPDFFNEVIDKGGRLDISFCVPEKSVGDYVMMKEIFNGEYTGRCLLVKIEFIDNKTRGLDSSFEVAGFRLLDLK